MRELVKKGCKHSCGKQGSGAKPASEGLAQLPSKSREKQSQQFGVKTSSANWIKSD